MENFPVKKLILLLIILSVTITTSDAQRYKRSVRNPERALFGKSLNTKKVKYREAPSIVRAKKKQAANKEKIKKEYKAIVKVNRIHSVDIQSPEVKKRMLDNRKEADSKYKEKKKKRGENSKRAGKKYK
jgi:hypothetical protein